MAHVIRSEDHGRRMTQTYVCWSRPMLTLRCCGPLEEVPDPLQLPTPSRPPPILPAVPRAWSRLRSRVRHVLSWQAPPRRFWTWWCGGMDVQDALVLAFVLALNAYYFAYYVQAYTNRVDASE